MTMMRGQAWGIAILISLRLGASICAAELLTWDAAYVCDDPFSLVLLPMRGPKSVVQLPGELRTRLVRAFGSDGRAVYAFTDKGIVRVQFNPLSQEIVPGTSELGRLWSLTVAKGSGHLFASGMTSGICGTFEIDPVAGTMRPLRTGNYPACGGGGGVVSPDGRRAIRHVQASLRITDLSTGAVEQIPGFAAPETSGDTMRDDAMWLNRTRWSPDGRWISVVDDSKRVVLIDSSNLVRRKHLGSSSGVAEWSPDSRYLLVEKPELRCALDLYFFSLEGIDVETGRKFMIKGSRCNVGTGGVGWMDPAIAQSVTPVEARSK